jgi:hypothetical protein
MQRLLWAGNNERCEPRERTGLTWQRVLSQCLRVSRVKELVDRREAICKLRAHVGEGRQPLVDGAQLLL